MRRLPPRSPRPYTLLPYTMLFRSVRLQQRGLALARLSLVRYRSIVRGEDQGRGGKLPRIEWMLRDCPKSRGRVGSRQDGICGALAFRHEVEDLRLDARRSLVRHLLSVACRVMGRSHTARPLLAGRINQSLHTFAGATFGTACERS